MPMRDVYFVEQGLVCVSVKIESERDVTGWLIGSKGMTGIPVLIGAPYYAPYRRVVCVGGSALKIEAVHLQTATREIAQLRALLMQYVEFVLGQSTQCGVCSAHHTVRQRTARWILDGCASLDSDRLPLGHTLLARLLGVRRASISECLHAMAAEGFIRNTRNLIQVVDPDGLQSTACDCHRIIKREYRRLLDAPGAGHLSRNVQLTSGPTSPARRSEVH
jgi:CRP-like cAMP-binding protein